VTIVAEVTIVTRNVPPIFASCEHMSVITFQVAAISWRQCDDMQTSMAHLVLMNGKPTKPTEQTGYPTEFCKAERETLLDRDSATLFAKRCGDPKLTNLRTFKLTELAELTGCATDFCAGSMVLHFG
jgi:hypothetical protein